MDPETSNLEVDSEQTYVVYDRKTGAIVHIHRIVVHRGAETVAEKQARARTLEVAAQFGYRGDAFRLLRADSFEPGVAQRVDVKTQQLTASPPRARSRAKRPTAKRKRR